MSRRALVTGASGAFGTALRARLRERGWRVAGLDRRADPEDEDVLTCDVTDEEAVPARRGRRRSSGSAAGSTCW